MPCNLCEQPFRQGHRALTCNACKIKSHTTCLKISNDEYKIYSEQGSFKCQKCLQTKTLIGDDTPVKGIPSKPKGDILKTPTPLHQDIPPISNPYDDLFNRLSDFFERKNKEIVDSLRVEIESFRGVVEDLKNENSSLKNTISELKEKLNNLPSSSLKIKNTKKGDPSSPPYSLVTSESVSVEQKSTDSNKNNNPSQIFPPLPPSSQIVDAENGGWTTVARKRKQPSHVKASEPAPNPKPPQRKNHKNVIIGCGKKDPSLVKKKTKCIFVSRLAPDVESTTLEALLENVLQSDKMVCTRLKTKYPSYSSFHIKIDADGYDLLINPEVWPEGTLICPFLGRLQEDQIFVNKKPQEGGHQTTE